MKKKHNRKGTDSLPFRKILAALMAERRLSIQQVSDLAGVSRSVVADWVKGANPHDLLAVERLADALGISFKSLLLGTEEAKDARGLKSISEIYDEVEFFEGLCRVTIKKLVPRQK